MAEDRDGIPEAGMEPPDDSTLQADAKRRFRDLTRIRMRDVKILTDAEEAALLELALGPLGLSLATARGILLHQSLENGVMLESREDRRVLELIGEQARDGRLDRRSVREAMIMAGPAARALGREHHLRAHVAELADRVGVKAKCGVSVPGPRRWSVASADCPGNAGPAWWAAR